jgi:hypothetical protein
VLCVWGCVRRSVLVCHLSGRARSNPPAVTRRGHATLRSRTRANTFSSSAHPPPPGASPRLPRAPASPSIGPSALGDQDHMGEMGAIAMCTGRVVLDGGEMDPSHLRMHGSHLRPISSRRRAGQGLRSAIDARLGASARGARPRSAHAHTSSGARSQCILPGVPSLSDERHLLSCGSPRLDANAPCAEYLFWRLFHSRRGLTTLRASGGRRRVHRSCLVYVSGSAEQARTRGPALCRAILARTCTVIASETHGLFSARACGVQNLSLFTQRLLLLRSLSRYPVCSLLRPSFVAITTECACSLVSSTLLIDSACLSV